MLNDGATEEEIDKAYNTLNKLEEFRNKAWEKFNSITRE
jgi:hypothetical protein